MGVVIRNGKGIFLAAPNEPTDFPLDATTIEALQPDVAFN
jgi:hypothetical protein